MGKPFKQISSHSQPSFKKLDVINTSLKLDKIKQEIYDSGYLDAMDIPYNLPVNFLAQQIYIICLQNWIEDGTDMCDDPLFKDVMYNYGFRISLKNDTLILIIPILFYQRSEYFRTDHMFKVLYYSFNEALNILKQPKYFKLLQNICIKYNLKNIKIKLDIVDESMIKFTSLDDFIDSIKQYYQKPISPFTITLYDPYDAVKEIVGIRRTYYYPINSIINKLWSWWIKLLDKLFPDDKSSSNDATDTTAINQNTEQNNIVFTNEYVINYVKNYFDSVFYRKIQVSYFHI